jgi:hypothetical protein
MDAERRIAADPILSTGKVAPRNRFIDSIPSSNSTIANYCDELTSRYDSAGWHSVRSSSKQTQHFIWAVEFQILKLRHTEIARQIQLSDPTGNGDRSGVTIQAVSKAVNGILKDIGLKNRLNHQ